MAAGWWAEKLQALGYAVPEWCIPPTEALVADYERRVGLTLPADYRHFLVGFGGAAGSAVCAFQEPTPCGTETIVESFYGFTPPDGKATDVRWATELIDGYPAMVAIAEGILGGMI